SDLENKDVASVLLVSGGGIAGIIGGALIATPLVPEYIPDNRALFIMGGMWIGAAEGVGVGIIGAQAQATDCAQVDENGAPMPQRCRPKLGLLLRAGFVGSLPGLTIGLTTGALLADRAPTYGRVAVIQSAALGGSLAGALI